LNKAAIEFKNATKRFSEKKIFENLNLQIEEGSFITLLGPSGCGKSTLLRTLADLETLNSGELQIPDSLKHSLSYVFQESNLLGWKNVEENIRLPFEVGNLKDKYSVTQVTAQTQKVLRQVRLHDAGKLFPHELSGGMKMRVSLARAMVTSPKLLLMDEPFAALDEITRFEMQNQLLELWQTEKMTVVFVTHSLFEAAYLSQRVILMKKSGITSDLTLPLPAQRNEALRISEQMAHVVHDLSERFRA
jgi:NitT/TauT family transport system ATP-binding protein